VLAPESTPNDGPLGFPPPQEYGTPICDAPRRITYSIACLPLTRFAPGGTAPAGTLASLPVRPRLLRNLRPNSIVVWVARWVACSDALAIATGSPGAPELMIFGRVGSHCSSSGAAVAGPAKATASASMRSSTRVVWTMRARFNLRTALNVLQTAQRPTTTPALPIGFSSWASAQSDAGCTRVAGFCDAQPGLRRNNVHHFSHISHFPN
jgi:hypothetical protein